MGWNHSYFPYLFIDRLKLTEAKSVLIEALVEPELGPKLVQFATFLLSELAILLAVPELLNLRLYFLLDNLSYRHLEILQATAQQL